MRLPDSLQEAIERECSPFSHEDLRKASLHLTAQYQERASSIPGFQNPSVRAAYLAVRMPATYAAIHAALLECCKLMEYPPTSLVDLGAGPGTGAWAAAALFPSLSSISLVEQSRPMVEIGQRLCSSSVSPLLQSAKWSCQSLSETLPPADLSLLSYCVAELPQPLAFELLERLWNQTETIVVIEPGTPEGYRRILQIRDWALAKNAYLIAPCPHRFSCPMKAPDWCHFPARVERTRLHKFLKNASLGYEDEKFSYIAFGKMAATIPDGRIVGPIKKGTGFVQFPLCTHGELKLHSVRRSNESYRSARGAEWGDPWM